ncbi:hypothetical protein V8E36_003674 [Tilletia maclaganii]
MNDLHRSTRHLISTTKLVLQDPDLSRESDTTLVRGNDEVVLVNLAIAKEGALGVHRRRPDNNGGVPLCRGHSEAIWDFDISPQDNSVLATGCGDGVLRIFHLGTPALRVPSRTLKGKGREIDPTILPQQSLQGAGGSVKRIVFSPTASAIIAAATADDSIRLWDIEAAQPQSFLTGFSATIQDLSFNYPGVEVAAICRDGKLHTFDSRGGESSVSVVDGGKGMEETMTMNHGTGVITPFWSDNNIAFLASNGGTKITYFDLELDEFHLLGQHKSMKPGRGLCFLPGRHLKGEEQEIARAYTVNDDEVHSVSFFRPGRAKSFLIDDYIPTTHQDSLSHVSGFWSGDLTEDDTDDSTYRFSGGTYDPEDWSSAHGKASSLVFPCATSKSESIISESPSRPVTARIDRVLGIMQSDPLALKLTKAKINQEQGIAPALLTMFRKMLDVNHNLLPLLADDHGLEPSQITAALDQPLPDSASDMDRLCICCFRRPAKDLCEYTRRLGYTPTAGREERTEEAEELRLRLDREYRAQRKAEEPEYATEARRKRLKEWHRARLIGETEEVRNKRLAKDKEIRTAWRQGLSEKQREAKKQRRRKREAKKRAGMTDQERQAERKRNRAAKKARTRIKLADMPEEEREFQRAQRRASEAKRLARMTEEERTLERERRSARDKSYKAKKWEALTEDEKTSERARRQAQKKTMKRNGLPE